MNEKCPTCGANINDKTRDCTCGFRVYEARLIQRLQMLESAISGWQQQFAQIQRKIIEGTYECTDITSK